MSLKSDNCILREATYDDLPLMLKWRNLPHVVENMEYKELIMWNEHFRWFYRIQQEGYHYFIIETNDGTPIGTIYLSGIDEQNNTTSGLYIGDQRYLGTGITLEASKLIINYAFDELKVNAIIAKVNSENQKIIAYNEQLGFQRDIHANEHNSFITMKLSK